MTVLVRLAAYLAVLATVFGLMFLAGRTLVPESTVTGWTLDAERSSPGHEAMPSGRDEATGPAMEGK